MASALGFINDPELRGFGRIGIALMGLVVIIVGVVLLALPGPGWLIIFVGLGIWATKFAWARSLQRIIQHTVAEWTAWIRRRPRWLTMVADAVAVVSVAAVGVGVWLLAR